MECYSAEKKEILTYVTTWMNPENTMPSERSKPIKDHILYDSRIGRTLYPE